MLPLSSSHPGDESPQWQNGMLRAPADSASLRRDWNMREWHKRDPRPVLEGLPGVHRGTRHPGT